MNIRVIVSIIVCQVGIAYRVTFALNYADLSICWTGDEREGKDRCDTRFFFFFFFGRLPSVANEVKKVVY